MSDKLLEDLPLADCCKVISIEVNMKTGVSFAAHHGLLVSFLNGVTGDFRVAVVLWRLPLECHIEAPDIHDLQGLRGPRQIYRGEK